MGSRINFSNKWIIALLHASAWCIIFILPTFLESNIRRGMPPNFSEDNERAFFYIRILTYLLFIASFYIIGYILIPKFLLTKKYYSLVIFLLLLYAVVLAMHTYFFFYFNKNVPFSLAGSLMATLPAYIMTIVASAAYALTIDRWILEKQLLEKQQETMQTELSFLRSQISPHFIFNILNNIVALVRLKSDDLEPTVMKLSELMRYMLYDTDEEKINIENEASYLQSYIDLQKQRFGKKVKVNYHFETDNSRAEIEPMLLIPFVENAFKHGVGIIEKPFIDINLTIKGNSLTLIVKNKFNNESFETQDKNSGIGLKNVKRRLKILYAENHELSISKQNNLHIVLLKINLS